LTRKSKYSDLKIKKPKNLTGPI